MNTLTISEIANLIGAQMPSGLENSSLTIVRGAGLDDAREGDVAFYDNRRYLSALKRTKASLVLVPLDFAEPIEIPSLRVADASAAFDIVLDRLSNRPPSPPVGVHSTASVGQGVQIDPSASIGPNVVIEDGVVIGARTVIGGLAFVGRDSRIGADCLLHANAVLREGTLIGDRVIIHSGAVIGSDGFGFKFSEGKHLKVPQRGFVQIDDDVEIGACTTIDRARFGRTWIQTGTKIDNLVQIAHNVVVGPHCLIVAQTGISGSAKLGRYVTLAGQVGVVGHVEIGDQVVVAAKSGVSKDAAPRQQLMGMFGIPMQEARELVAHYHRLPKTAARLKALEAECAELRQLLQAKLAANDREDAR